MLRTDPRIALLDDVSEDDCSKGLDSSDDPLVVVVESLFSTETDSDLLERVTRMFPTARALVVIRTMNDEDLTALIPAGAFGCLTPDCRQEELVDAIQRVSQGEVLFPPAVLMRLITQQSHRERLSDSPGASESEESQNQPAAASSRSLPSTGSLAPRERQVLETLARGSSTDEVADQLGITVHTVRTHLKNVLAKLNAHSKLEAVVIALRRGLIDLPS